MTESYCLAKRSFWNLGLEFLLPLLAYAIYVSETLVEYRHLGIAWSLLLLAWACLAAGCAWWLLRPQSRSIVQISERVGTILVLVLITVTSSVLLAGSWWQWHYFGVPTNAEDTAYYSQLLWNTLHGHFLWGNVQQARIYHPPVNSDLALHVSPVLAGLLPLYALYPHAFTLLIIRDLALTSAAWPLFLTARDRIGIAAGVAAVGLYLLNPAVIAQTFEAFYLLQLAPLPFFWALRAFDRQQFRQHMLWMVLALTVREDVAITAAGFGLLALVRRLHWRWWLLGLAVPIGWWVLATSIIEPAFGRVSNSALDIRLAGGTKNPLGIYGILLGGPSWILQGLKAGGFYMLFRLLRAVGFLSLLGREIVLAIPVLSATIFLARADISGSDPYSRFALLPGCALIAATVLIVSRMVRKKPPNEKQAIAIILLLLFPAVFLVDSARAVLVWRLEDYTVHNDAHALREAIRLIPDNASVAAPDYMLPALANRTQLFYLQYMEMYPPVNPDYFLFDRDLSHIRVDKPERYAALLNQLSQASNYETIWQKGSYFLLRRKQGTTQHN